jgi:hypothetical protein
VPRWKSPGQYGRPDHRAGDLRPIILPEPVPGEARHDAPANERNQQHHDGYRQTDREVASFYNFCGLQVKQAIRPGQQRKNDQTTRVLPVTPGKILIGDTHDQRGQIEQINRRRRYRTDLRQRPDGYRSRKLEEGEPRKRQPTDWQMSRSDRALPSG